MIEIRPSSNGSQRWSLGGIINKPFHGVLHLGNGKNYEVAFFYPGSEGRALIVFGIVNKKLATFRGPVKVGDVQGKMQVGIEEARNLTDFLNFQVGTDTEPIIGSYQAKHCV
jgi:hypothetical protein